MKQGLFTLALILALTSCASMLTQHRMKAAERKLVATRDLQAQGDWAGALAMAEALHSSVSKSVDDKPVRKSALGAEVDLRPLLVAWENGSMKPLTSALNQRNGAAFKTAWMGMKQQCVTCHAALGRTDIKIAE